MKTTPKAQAVSGEVRAQESTALLTGPLKVVKQEEQTPGQLLAERIKRIADLNKKSAQLYMLRENLQALESFNVESDKVSDCVKIDDGNGNTWRTTNSFLVKRIQSVMVEEFNTKIDELNKEILSAII
jgi:hypothetical protein